MTKPTSNKYRDVQLEVMHKTAAGLARLGALDKKTMRDFDAFCLTKVEPMLGSDIQALRDKEGVSQAVLARHLNVSTKLVSDWERDVKRPSGPSLKLLDLLERKGLEVML